MVSVASSDQAILPAERASQACPQRTMGTCPSRQRAPPQAALVDNVQNLAGANAPPPPPAETSYTTPPPPWPPAADGPANADQLPTQTPALARRLALTEFFQHPVVTTPKGQKLHILNVCQHSQRKPGNTVWTWCEACTRLYQKGDASNPDSFLPR